jgi:hypothetical protein
VASKTAKVASVATKTGEVANVAAKTGEVANIASRTSKVAEVANTAGRVWNGAKSFGAEALTGVKSLGNEAWTGAKNLGDRAAVGAKTFGAEAWTGAKNLSDRAVVGAENWGNRALNAADHWGYEAQNWMSQKFPGVFGEPELAGIGNGLERPTPRPMQSVPERQQPLKMENHSPEGRGAGTSGKGTTPQSEPSIEKTTTNEPAIVKPKNLDELRVVNPKKTGDFSDISGKSVQEVLSRVPEGATMRKLTPVEGGSKVGVEYKWVDENGVTNRLRVHDADPSAPVGSNAAQGWVARHQVGGKYYDPEIGGLRPRNVHKPESPHYDPKAANDTHIPIETPDKSVSDLMKFQQSRREYLNQKFDRTGDVNLDINIRGRKEIATKFFMNKGVPLEKIDSFFTGIDFTKPLEVETLGSGKKLWQYQTPGAPQGSWYSTTPSVSPSELGISELGFNRATQTVEPKILNQYTTGESVSVLRSKSAAVEDFWSVSGQSYSTEGGATQLFSNERSKFTQNLQPKE